MTIFRPDAYRPALTGAAASRLMDVAYFSAVAALSSPENDPLGMTRYVMPIEDVSVGIGPIEERPAVCLTLCMPGNGNDFIEPRARVIRDIARRIGGEDAEEHIDGMGGTNLGIQAHGVDFTILNAWPRRRVEAWVPDTDTVGQGAMWVASALRDLPASERVVDAHWVIRPGRARDVAITGLANLVTNDRVRGRRHTQTLRYERRGGVTPSGNNQPPVNATLELRRWHTDDSIQPVPVAFE